MIIIRDQNDKIPEAATKTKNRAFNRPGNYTITVENTPVVYSGSSGCVNKRIGKHKNSLENGVHPYQELQEAYNENKNIIIDITYTKNREEAYQAEQALIDTGKCINKALDAKYPGKGVSPTEFNIQRIKETHTGKIVSDETRKKLSMANTGRVTTEETKEKLRQANLGKTASEETRQKLSAVLKGRVVSPETRNKISESKKGKGFPQVALDASMKLKCREVVVDGVRYCSLAEAARHLGVTDVTVRNRALSDKPEHAGYLLRDKDLSE